MMMGTVRVAGGLTLIDSGEGLDRDGALVVRQFFWMGRYRRRYWKNFAPNRKDFSAGPERNPAPPVGLLDCRLPSLTRSYTDGH